jgi:hypothetical protein
MGVGSPAERGRAHAYHSKIGIMGILFRHVLAILDGTMRSPAEEANDAVLIQHFPRGIVGILRLADLRRFDRYTRW